MVFLSNFSFHQISLLCLQFWRLSQNLRKLCNLIRKIARKHTIFSKFRRSTLTGKTVKVNAKCRCAVAVHATCKQ